MKHSITDIEGVYASAIASGIKQSGLDLVYISVPGATAAAGVFTRNSFCAACVSYNRAALQKNVVKAIVINSGNANAVTGVEGESNNRDIAAIAAERLGVAADEVAVASTGIIGKQLPMDRVRDGLKSLLANPKAREGDLAARGILTTDTCEKFCFHEQGTYQVAGIAKGSGMIAPNMATMLGFLVTNVAVPQNLLQEFLREASARTFNMISVDTDTSTNDMVLCLSTGAIPFDQDSEQEKRSFLSLLQAACEDLAIQIVRDGEGASRLIVVDVVGASTKKDAEAVAYSIANSPLVKTAIHGADPNWGRIVMAIGKVDSVEIIPQQVAISFQDLPVLASGSPVAFDRAELKQRMESDTVGITVSLGMGQESGRAWGCDLTKGYVDINTCYN